MVMDTAIWAGDALAMDKSVSGRNDKQKRRMVRTINILYHLTTIFSLLEGGRSCIGPPSGEMYYRLSCGDEFCRAAIRS